MTSAARTENKQGLAIAETILSQLGGKRFIAMTGASQFIAIDSGLQFSLPRNFAKDGINKMQVLLDPSDTYTVKALKCNYRKGTFEVVASHEDVYFDMLQSIFTDMTGLDTHL